MANASALSPPDAPPDALAALVAQLARLNPPAAPPAGLEPEEAAAHLGFLSRSTLDSYARAGLVPAPAKVGSLVVYCRAKLESWLAHGCPPAAEFELTWRKLLAAPAARAAK